MVETVAGFAHWEIGFDAAGEAVAGEQVERLRDGVRDERLTDLFVVAHGWNNDRTVARSLYRRFFTEVRAVLDDHGSGAGRRVGTLGVVWPSMRWADEEVPGEGGAAALGGPASDRELVGGLKAVLTASKQRAALDELGRLLEERPRSDEALGRFQELMRQVATGPDAGAAPEDGGEVALLTGEPREVFTRFADEAPADGGEGGAAGLGDAFSRLWAGAKEALRQATYWQMKKRAGLVGERGLGPLVGHLHADAPELRVHLVGHSFGARLVSFCLAGLPPAALEPRSPVKSVLLIQGAFSHFAFAEELPHDRSRSGALAGMAARVDGPLVVSHSVFDTAVGRLYPLASIASGQDAAAMDDLLYRWGAIGHDGAQAVGAAAARLGTVGAGYEFRAGRFLNVDADEVIRSGQPPSGAHSDIFHPELAWVAVAAAGIA